MESNQLSSSQEDYLESILHLVEKNQVARVKEIASALNVNKSSVSAAMKQLAAKGLINYAPYGYITLTDTGKELAQSVDHFHKTLKMFFKKILMVDDALAEEAACRMEHEVPAIIIHRLVQFTKWIDQKDTKISESSLVEFHHLLQKENS